METPRFVHLHLHTDYSLLDGACDLEEVVDEAARRKMPAVAVTDHGNLFAAESFYHAAKTRGVKPIIGCEVYVAKGSRTTAATRRSAIAATTLRPLSKASAATITWSCCAKVRKATAI